MYSTAESPESSSSSHPYRPELPERELIQEIRALLGRQQIIERLICRYLADLADRIAKDREVNPFGGYLNVYEAAERLFGFAERRTRERVRVGRALRALPRIERAFERGELGFTRVREITRVACRESEAVWLELGRTLPTRELERRVIAAGHRARGVSSEETEFLRGSGEAGADRRGALGSGEGGADRRGALLSGEGGADRRGALGSGEGGAGVGRPDKLRLVFELEAEDWLAVRSALQVVRARTGRKLTDAEALAVLARDAVPAPHRTAEPDHAAVQDDATRAGSSERGGDMTPAGSRDALHDAGAPDDTTPAGSRERTSMAPRGMRGALADDETTSNAAILLRKMVSRRRWYTDQLCEVTGLSLQAVGGALLRLQLEGAVLGNLGCYYLAEAA